MPVWCAAFRLPCPVLVIAASVAGHPNTCSFAVAADGSPSCHDIEGETSSFMALSPLQACHRPPMWSESV